MFSSKQQEAGAVWQPSWVEAAGIFSLIVDATSKKVQGNTPGSSKKPQLQ